MRKSWRRDRQARSFSSREGDKKHDSSHGAYSAEEFHEFMSYRFIHRKRATAKYAQRSKKGRKGWMGGRVGRH